MTLLTIVTRNATRCDVGTLGSQRCCTRPGIFSLGGQHKDSHVPEKSRTDIVHCA